MYVEKDNNGHIIIQGLTPADAQVLARCIRTHFLEATEAPRTQAEERIMLLKKELEKITNMLRQLHTRKLNTSRPETANQVEITISDRERKIKFTKHITEIESLFKPWPTVLITRISLRFMVIEIPEVKDCNEEFGRFIESVLLQLRSHYN